ncbi:FAD:protein FMN transferase [Phytohabitans rumicis]|uniref:FAD:protein FMN transferase n=1 Tax=Phytohabitans rumicis TaxID=1076125 RepID=A0A6V8L8T8_9ACTN|nr:FAD:protein FMN transferase [Phytohabitans rumicis]GFJ90417.1 FAD:protein FMN transferase [Phytohabitans rumicis]
MPLLENLPVGVDTAQWPVWSTTARLVVTDPAVLPTARRLVEAELLAVELACSRFREDSELRRLRPAAGRPVRVSLLLAELIEAALWAAEHSDGDVDPTVGAALYRLGYDRDFADLPAYRAELPIVVVPAPGWHQVKLEGQELTIPPAIKLDLGATAKAFTADRCARLVAERCGVGVLVSLGGDIATAGPEPDGGWRVLVQDGPDQPHCTIALAAGMALATSSTISRRWLADGRTLHHILDPRTCQPADPVWRTVTVAAEHCLEANMLSTAALVRGHHAPTSLHKPARLVTASGEVLTLNGWPA